mmetsp:Transcript_25691/g.64166  ORF Transcript_25691/g.64166 Transcript_25691/m.64166 type:complete len:366 (+) Transcript_25691:914-2011(+)
MGLCRVDFLPGCRWVCQVVKALRFKNSRRYLVRAVMVRKKRSDRRFRGRAGLCQDHRGVVPGHHRLDLEIDPERGAQAAGAPVGTGGGRALLHLAPGPVPGHRPHVPRRGPGQGRALAPQSNGRRSARHPGREAAGLWTRKTDAADHDPEVATMPAGFLKSGAALTIDGTVVALPQIHVTGPATVAEIGPPTAVAGRAMIGRGRAVHSGGVLRWARLAAENGVVTILGGGPRKTVAVAMAGRGRAAVLVQVGAGICWMRARFWRSGGKSVKVRNRREHHHLCNMPHQEEETKFGLFTPGWDGAVASLEKGSLVSVQLSAMLSCLCRASWFGFTRCIFYSFDKIISCGINTRRGVTIPNRALTSRF